MKIINKISALLSAALFAALLTSCSEFMLIPISIDYPFEEKNEEASPSTYTIDVDAGLKSIEKMFNGEVRSIVDKSFQELLDKGAEITYPRFDTKDIIDLISGVKVVKQMSYDITLPNGNHQADAESVTFSICDFKDSVFEEDEEEENDSESNSVLEFKNIETFCNSSENEQTAKIRACQDTIDETCLHIEIRQENESIKIKMGEQKELKKYKKYLSKIYSATLSDFTFTIKNPLTVEPGKKPFQLKAELYAQPIDPFRDDGVTPCKDDDDLTLCKYKGVDGDGYPDNYFSPSDGDMKKYLIGVFETDDETYSSEQVMNLLYTYDGKDTLQHAIKHLDFQLGIKSYYIFYPQAAKPEGKLEASIKAKLLFNVEPLN